MWHGHTAGLQGCPNAAHADAQRRTGAQGRPGGQREGGLDLVQGPHGAGGTQRRLGLLLHTHASTAVEAQEPKSSSL